MCGGTGREGRNRVGFAEEFGHEFGGFDSNLLLIGDFNVCVDLEDWHCAVVLGSETT